MRTFASGFSAQYLPSFRYLRQTPCQLQSPPISMKGRARRRTHDVGGRIAMRRDRLGASVGRTRLELRGKDRTMGRRTYESTHTGMRRRIDHATHAALGAEPYCTKSEVVGRGLLNHPCDVNLLLDLLVRFRRQLHYLLSRPIAADHSRPLGDACHRPWVVALSASVAR
jgi:hypothetical protein